MKLYSQVLSTAFLLSLILLSACQLPESSSSEQAQITSLKVATNYPWELPQGFPLPPVPQDNPMSASKVELGRHLFYDRRMSINEVKSCGDCHHQRLAFSDGLPTAIGITVNELHARNAQGLTNVAYNPTLTWANPNLLTLETQALAVLMNETPVELGWSDREDEILDRFRYDAIYQEMFVSAFPEEDDPYTIENVLKALASFQRTLISGNSAYDRYINGDDNAIGASAARGKDLFFSERLECHHCHGGFNFTETANHDGSPSSNVIFHNNGLYNIDVNGDGKGDGNYPADNTGLWQFTGRSTDMGRFRAPTLRNIALSAPYMHDGSITTLESVIVDHYARGGRLIEEGPNAGDGSKSVYRSSLIVSFLLSQQEVKDLLAFLDSLTDWEFICNPALSDPFGNIPMHENCS
ncbi:MAG: di-heme enzyme [Gammaproteobacteria bacterium]|nr:di-heme enzyme [Gammaproteobacteria bacterium]